MPKGTPGAVPVDPIARPQPSQLEQFWRVVVLAERLSCTRQSIYKMIKRGQLDAVRLVGGLRVPESSVLDYISRCRARTPAEIVDYKARAAKRSISRQVQK